MCAESPFFEESSARLILTRARGLGILTFDKIKKIVFMRDFVKCDFVLLKYTIILSKLNMPLKNDVKNFFMGLQFYGEQDFLHLCLRGDKLKAIGEDGIRFATIAT